MAGSPAHVCVFLLAFLAFVVLLFACAGLAGSRFRQGCVSVWVGGFGGPFLFANACGVSGCTFDRAKGGTRQRRSRHCTLTLNAGQIGPHCKGPRAYPLDLVKGDSCAFEALLVVGPVVERVIPQILFTGSAARQKQ